MIVIGLLGAIALIVIAAINPIEQANRARDTRFKADGGQLISAIDRYFAANSEFPWMNGTTLGTGDSYGFVSAHTEGVGICASTCTGDSSNGLLISTSEIKTEFKNRDFVKKPASGTFTADEALLLGKDEGSSSSIYACFIPKANSTKKTSAENESVYTLDTSNGTRTSTTSCDGANGDGTGVNWLTNLCYVCIPE